MKKDEFYIGWEEESPESIQRFGIIVLIIISLLTISLTSIWLVKSDGFASSRFDFGNKSTFKGIIYEYPAPMLVVFGSEDTTSIPLVNFGKFGVAKPIKYFKSQMRNNLLNYEVELRGTKIEFDGKMWLELTDEERSLLTFRKLDNPSPQLDILYTGRIEISGEIVDPKCFFGVMKPGFGKVHLSCAVRCISGGVPPILVSQEENGARSYYFVIGKNGKMINNDILNYVGVPVSISGLSKQVLDWNILEITAEDLSIASNYEGPSIFDACMNDPQELKLAELEDIKL